MYALPMSARRPTKRTALLSALLATATLSTAGAAVAADQFDPQLQFAMQRIGCPIRLHGDGTSVRGLKLR